MEWLHPRCGYDSPIGHSFEFAYLAADVIISSVATLYQQL
jgi:hypothetical protein